jgi:hypothetical protein
MTETEIEIIKTEYEHHEKLMSEIVANKSFSGALASIAAFIVLEWLRSSNSPPPWLAVVAVLLLCASAFLFFKLCLSEGFKFPSQAENWSDWRTKRLNQLTSGGWPDTSELDLRKEYYIRYAQIWPLIAALSLIVNIMQSWQASLPWFQF